MTTHLYCPYFRYHVALPGELLADLSPGPNNSTFSVNVVPDSVVTKDGSNTYLYFNTRRGVFAIATDEGYQQDTEPQ